MSVHNGPILLIDDDDNVHALLRYHLERAGFDLVSVKDPSQALEAISRNNDFIAVLVDINLPRADVGWALLGQLGKLKKTQLSHTPIVVYSVDDDKARAKAAGADEHIIKPNGQKEILNLLEHYAAQRRG
jgi:two-component system alkaline phosphatase synthesis response regulator PhoP